jgi:hypothetical protein
VPANSNRPGESHEEVLTTEASDEPTGDGHAHVPLEDLIPAPAPSATSAQLAAPAAGLRTARGAKVDGVLHVMLRGAKEPVIAELAPEVEAAVIDDAIAHDGSLLVEIVPGMPPLVVGVVQTRVAREVVVKGSSITVEAEREIVLRAGRAALRLREDGDVELVGTRISASSRGLFRLVGRILRLN